MERLIFSSVVMCLKVHLAPWISAMISLDGLGVKVATLCSSDMFVRGYNRLRSTSWSVATVFTGTGANVARFCGSSERSGESMYRSQLRNVVGIGMNFVSVPSFFHFARYHSRPCMIRAAGCFFTNRSMICFDLDLDSRRGYFFQNASNSSSVSLFLERS